ncbi:glycoside hydrolase family 88 protein [uncultured Aquimarina sp.]|uniref:glycoside hydrolase family 88 protein n=1 Tax=uncultured Aquimarina sp. TaxID=575652 RepID=UPI002604220A|nr:glycoside hydrolase family 88 protein [uncultured Aquimarina sp.]
MIYYILILLIIILSVLLLVIGIDLFFYYKSVFQRYKIGRWTDQNNWLKSVKQINLTWLRKTPTVKLTDNESYIIKDLLKGHYRSTTIQSWQEAGALLGAIDTENTKEKIDEFINNKIDIHTGTWKQVPQYVDGAILAYALTKTNVDVIKLKPAFDQVIELIDRCKGEDGTIFYRDFIPSIRFVDTIGFICPFLTYYGQKFNKPEYIDLALLQIQSYVAKAFLPNKMIPAHAYDLKKDMPLGIYGWGRGLGWFILGITDMYYELDETHSSKIYLKELVEKTAKDALVFQKEDGGFNAMIAVDSSRHDSSITAIAGWLFYTAFTIDKDEKYLLAAKRCVQSLMKVTRRDGVIDFCQGDTKGIGLYATTFDLMPFVQGLTIRLSSAIESK